MRIKPKEVQVNLPCHFEFHDESECVQMVSNINAILRGRTQVKYDLMGSRGQMLVGLLYLERSKEYQDYRNFLLKVVVDQEQ